MTRSLAIIVAISCVASTARAQPTAAVQQKRRDHVVSVGLWSLQGFAGLSGQYEARFRERWSWIAGGGVRFNAGGDYASHTLAAGGEARYWLKGRAVWTRAAPRSLLGWYLGGRIDLAWTRTRDALADRSIGDNLSTAVTASLGYRFLIRERVELTPMMGLGATRETDLRGRLPGWTRGTGRLGLTLGWMF